MATVLLLVLFVWPTPYTYNDEYDICGYPRRCRVSRFSGEKYYHIQTYSTWVKVGTYKILVDLLRSNTPIPDYVLGKIQFQARLAYGTLTVNIYNPTEWGVDEIGFKVSFDDNVVGNCVSREIKKTGVDCPANTQKTFTIGGFPLDTANLLGFVINYALGKKPLSEFTPPQ
ncbi:MAG: hypothetical protein WC712_12875 [Candidatus Brocadiia bacterium]